MLLFDEMTLMYCTILKRIILTRGNTSLFLPVNVAYGKAVNDTFIHFRVTMCDQAVSHTRCHHAYCEYTWTKVNTFNYIKICYQA